MRLSRLLLTAGLVLTLVALAIIPVLSSVRDRVSNTTIGPKTQIESRYHLPGVNVGALESSPQSVSVLDDRRRPVKQLRADAAVSPGIEICGGALGGTTYDYQAHDDNQRMIALTGSPGDPHVNFVWNHWDRVPDSLDAIEPTVAFNCWTQSGGLGLGNCGFAFQHESGNFPFRFPTVDVSSDGKAHIALSEWDSPLDPSWEYATNVMNAAAQCFNVFADEQLAGSAAVPAIWPHISIDRAGSAERTPGDDVFHVVSHRLNVGPTIDGNELLYWRRIGPQGNAWEGPVVLDRTAGTLNHHVAVDPTSERVAIFYQRDNLDPNDLLQVGYLESSDNGANWIDTGVVLYPDPVEPEVGPYVPITSYAGSEPDASQAWVECSGEYDYDGTLHAVWIEQVYANVYADCRVMHWDDVHGTRVVREAIGWNNVGGDGGRDLWLALPNIAFGDGSTSCTNGPGDLTNRNYVYVTYEQYGGPTPAEANDVSTRNYQNLDIYLGVSNDGGQSFSLPLNLTDTKTPGCAGEVPGSECASERDPSLAKLVNDTIHLQYVLDTDAGDAVFGQGVWTFNPVMYYRIPGGTDAEYLCPPVAPVIDARLANVAPLCEYHAGLTVPPLQTSDDLVIENDGNATLTGSISTSLSSDWLQVTAGGYTVVNGDPPDVRTVTMDAGAASVQSGGEGLYQDSIVITHNDSSQTSPLTIPIDFFVFDEFYCPEEVTINTGWLWLAVSNVATQGDQTQAGGLARLDPVVGDSSSSIYESSLLIGVPPNPDTLVYRMLTGSGNGQPGFRALSSLNVDTSAYGTAYYHATATGELTTVDSTLGIDVEYIFPQHPDSCEFVIVKYAITNLTPTAMTDLVIGQGTDLDVAAPADIPQPFTGTRPHNEGALMSDFNLVYQHGVDTAGHAISGDTTATRYRAGVTALQDVTASRAWIAPSDPWLGAFDGQQYTGWSDGYLYQQMTQSAFELVPPLEPADLHSVMVFDNGVDLASGETRYYQVGYVSSNTGTDDADLLTTTRKAWRYCFGWNEFTVYDSMPNPASPKSYPYHAIGTHENGIAGGCSGCIVWEVADPEGAFSIVPGADPCYGTIEFSGTNDDMLYTATFRVTDLCSDYSDDITIEVVVGEPVRCSCPYQGDIDANGFRDVVDLDLAIHIYFFSGPDPQEPFCPIRRVDIDGNGFSDAVDMNLLIQHLFFNGPLPCNPCDPSQQELCEFSW